MSKAKKKETVAEQTGPTIWDHIASSVNEENKESVLKQLSDGLEFLESTGDKKTAKKVQETINKIG